MTKLSFDLIKVGDTLPEHSIVISQELINSYAEITGDFNPIHVDIQAAAKSEFAGTIAHGPIALEPVIQSLCKWMNLLWINAGTKMQFRFLAPSRPGDTIRSEAKIIGKREEGKTKIVDVGFSSINQKDVTVVSGQWEIIIL